MLSPAISTPSELPAVGAVLEGKYRLEAELGRGGMGVVFRGVHLKLNRPVAIKMLLPEALQAADAVERFDREARAAVQVKSHYVAEVLDVGWHQGLPYMVMEYLDGNDLAVELATRGPLPAAEAVGWLLQVCEAMADAHTRGVIHRDLKPSNLFLAKQGGERKVKILDFGISKIVTPGEINLTKTSAGFGTAHYISPEQIRSTKHADARSDVWSLGVIGYELLSGRLPFEGESAQSIVAAILTDAPAPLGRHRPELHPGLAEAIHKALVKERDKRTPSMAAFAEALRPFLAGAEPQAPAGDTDAVTLRKVPRVAGKAWVGGVALLGVVALAGVGLKMRPDATPAAPEPVALPSVAAPEAPSASAAQPPASASAAPPAESASKKSPGQPPPKTKPTAPAPPTTKRTNRLE